MPREGRLSHDARMRLSIDGHEVELGAARLGGPVKAAAGVCFRLAASREELSAPLEEELRALAEQARSTGDVYGAAEHELQRRGWPPAAALLREEPALLSALVREAGLGQRLLERLLAGLPAPGRGPLPRYELWRVDEVRFDTQGAELCGRGRDLRPAAAGPEEEGAQADAPGPPQEAEEAGRGRKERKVRAQDAQKLGVRLLALSPEELARLELPEELAEALLLAKRLKREAQRRQLQFIGRLMRSIDTAPLRDYFEGRDEENAREVDRLQRIDRWRNELVAGDEHVLQEILDVCPAVDLDHLSDLTGQARAEAAADKPPRGSRALFRYLRALLEQSGMD